MRHSLKGQEREKHEVLPTKNRHSTTFDADPNSAISPKYKRYFEKNWTLPSETR